MVVSLSAGQCQIYSANWPRAFIHRLVRRIPARIRASTRNTGGNRPGRPARGGVAVDSTALHVQQIHNALNAHADDHAFDGHLHRLGLDPWRGVHHGPSNQRTSGFNQHRRFLIFAKFSILGRHRERFAKRLFAFLGGKVLFGFDLLPEVGRQHNETPYPAPAFPSAAPPVRVHSENTTSRGMTGRC